MKIAWSDAPTKLDAPVREIVDVLIHFMPLIHLNIVFAVGYILRFVE